MCRIIDNQMLWADTRVIAFDAPELARTLRPGHVALARDPNTFDPYLRRKLNFYSARENRIEFSIDASDPLAVRARPGDVLDLLAPIGRAIDFESYHKRIVLVGENKRIAELIAVAHDALENDREVVLMMLSGWLDSAGKPEKFPIHLLSPEIEFRSEDRLGAVSARARFRARLDRRADSVRHGRMSRVYHRHDARRETGMRRWIDFRSDGF